MCLEKELFSLWNLSQFCNCSVMLCFLIGSVSRHDFLFHRELGALKEASGKILQQFSHVNMVKWSRNNRSSRPEVFCKIYVVRNFTKFARKHLCQSHRCFPVNFAKFLTAPFFTETTPVAVSEWTLLMKTDIQYTQGPITISSFQRFRGVFLSFLQKFLPADIFKQYRLSESNLIKNKRRTVKKHKEQWENQRTCINCVTTEKVIFEEVL